MIRSRRLRFRVSLFALVALLWAQLAFASHSDCIPDVGALLDAATPAAAAQACGHEVRSAAHSVCQGHCDQGDVSSDVGRVPPVPPLPGLPATPRIHLTVPPASSLGASAIVRAPPASWRGPTPHPSTILLI
ncbi:hypothetical protein [Luteimonas granuli]|uniref:CopL family metal-binding regulatory protein n=1 Tax=Luteimonas granuli TaxID=1176533 RepID=A0A518N188_9GAMM|nr:hypothetical protein [Luteimonas granuli]QDW65659.1 hypothetical protein FPZ22_01050 [Luteimonas granuli]